MEVLIKRVIKIANGFVRKKMKQPGYAKTRIENREKPEIEMKAEMKRFFVSSAFICVRHKLESKEIVFSHLVSLSKASTVGWIWMWFAIKTQCSTCSYESHPILLACESIKHLLENFTHFNSWRSWVLLQNKSSLFLQKQIPWRQNIGVKDD